MNQRGGGGKLYIVTINVLELWSFPSSVNNMPSVQVRDTAGRERERCERYGTARTTQASVAGVWGWVMSQARLAKLWMCVYIAEGLHHGMDHRWWLRRYDDWAQEKEAEKPSGDYPVRGKELLSKSVCLMNIDKCVSRPCGLRTRWWCLATFRAFRVELISCDEAYKG